METPVNDLNPAALTARLQSAIDAAHAAGGGLVTVPPGIHRCGSLELKSGVALQVPHGSRLVAADDPSLFPDLGRHDPKLTANSGFSALVHARGATDIALIGGGTLDGGGDWDAAPDWLTAQGLFRPATGYFADCRGLVIEGVRMTGSKWWTLHLLRCEDVRIRGVSIRSNWPNSDGIDPDGCRNVIISDCHLVCGDDCIVAKSTQGDPCENLVVTNCILETCCACIKFGTESIGAFRNIAVSNCILRGGVCFALYLKDGGSMEDITATNLIMESEAAYPVVIDAMPRDYRAGRAGVIRNVQLSHCNVRGPGRVWIEGTAAEPLENIRLESIDWTVTGPLPAQPAGKPLGSARVIVDPARPRLEVIRSHVVANHVRNLHLAGFHLAGAHAPDRALLARVAP